MNEIEQLQAELAALKATQAELRKTIDEMQARLWPRPLPPSEPHNPFHHLDRVATLPQNVIDDMVRAVPDFRQVAIEDLPLRVALREDVRHPLGHGNLWGSLDSHWKPSWLLG